MRPLGGQQVASCCHLIYWDLGQSPEGRPASRPVSGLQTAWLVWPPSSGLPQAGLPVPLSPPSRGYSRLQRTQDPRKGVRRVHCCPAASWEGTCVPSVWGCSRPTSPSLKAGPHLAWEGQGSGHRAGVLPSAAHSIWSVPRGQQSPSLTTRLRSPIVCPGRGPLQGRMVPGDLPPRWAAILHAP